MTHIVRSIIAVALVSLTMSVAALAQQASVPNPKPPAPVVRVVVDPPRVVVGQSVTLRIDVLAPNYMTSPPVLPDFQVRNAITRQLQSINMSETHDGLTYAGVRFEFAIHPQEPGSYAVTDQKLTVKYAAEPPQTREATLSLPRIEFQSFIPDAAAKLNPFVAATKLTVEQTVQRSLDTLKIGDAITRTVTIKATGVPAMLLPPVVFAQATGLALYPAQPFLHDSTDSRTGVLSATRVDAATYILQSTGDFLLPGVVIHWWNLASEKIESVHLDAVTLHVIDNPLARRSPSEAPSALRRFNTFVDFVSSHWSMLVLVGAVMIALAWFFLRIVHALTAQYRWRRDAWLASEARSFMLLLAAACRRSTGKVYCALLNWLARFNPIGPNHTIAAFKMAANDHDLDRQIDAIETSLFSPQEQPHDWSVRKLVAALCKARRRLLRQASRDDAARQLPPGLNPVAAASPMRHRRRPVAR